MSMRIEHILVVFALIAIAPNFLCGCANRPVTTPHAREAACEETLRSAAAYLGGLRSQDKLPGFHRGDHGSLSSISQPVWDDDVGIAYPVSIWFRGKPEAADSSWYYLVFKQDKQGAWRLEEAAEAHNSSYPRDDVVPK